MKRGLQKTWSVLVRSPLETATALAVQALDAEDPRLQEGAFHCLLERRDPAGHRELLQRWSQLPKTWQEEIIAQPGRLSFALRAALSEQGGELANCACEIAQRSLDYHLLPALAAVAETEGQPCRRRAAATVLALCDALYEELIRDFDPDRRDPRVVQSLVLETLAQVLHRSRQCEQPELVESFLLLARRDNELLLQIVTDPHDKNHLAVVDGLTRSRRMGVLRLLVGFLSEHLAPMPILNIISRRKDVAFIGCLLRYLHGEEKTAVLANLKRISSFRWLAELPQLVTVLNEAEQVGLVRLAEVAGIKRDEALEILRAVLAKGQVAARRAAAKALVTFPGATANELVVQKLDDEDPEVVANLVVQLRERGIPGALSKLMQLLGHPSGLLREAARKSLADFRLPRFLNLLPQLDAETRRHTALIVRQVDPEALSLLARELQAPSRTRRIRALEAIAAFQALAELEAELLACLQDPDQFVRATTARIAAVQETPALRAALQQALTDPHPLVRYEAERAWAEWNTRTSPSGSSRPTPPAALPLPPLDLPSPPSLEVLS